MSPFQNDEASSARINGKAHVSRRMSPPSLLSCLRFSCCCIVHVGDGKDEPTSGLDSYSSLELMNIMKRLTSKVGRHRNDFWKI